MKNTKQTVLNDLISLMDATRDKALTGVKLVRPGDLDSYHPNLANGPIPSDPNLAKFNVASELAKRILNADVTVETIVGQYQPGIINELIKQHVVDYENPRNVKNVVDVWLGIAELEY
ncbi:hypothetical protein [Lentilactobacillus farraginis]|uniref:Uncharacterized protein n=2 Tax=Lentilactobacillus farraginis DSM 18382 = JCM 14108 TaxID=1423743 RepID=X0PI53_9LACO|nr:hypothetical protein [Lentilactobacillus farraginis]GAF36762.1 hypothetical protein JCM14108_1745 [Lentilactobacillus farraginis DSM 18382 = JCM 14108]